MSGGEDALTDQQGRKIAPLYLSKFESGMPGRINFIDFFNYYWYIRCLFSSIITLNKGKKIMFGYIEIYLK